MVHQREDTRDPKEEVKEIRLEGKEARMEVSKGLVTSVASGAIAAASARTFSGEPEVQTEACSVHVGGTWVIAHVQKAKWEVPLKNKFGFWEMDEEEEEEMADTQKGLEDFPSLSESTIHKDQGVKMKLKRMPPTTPQRFAKKRGANQPLMIATVEGSLEDHWK